MSKLDRTIAGTKKLSPEQLQDSQRTRSAVSLLVYHREGTSSHALIEGQPLIVGRQAAVAIPDASLSREHARFELIGAEVWIEDLDSTNGTRVAGALVAGRRRINPGDEVLLGSVCVSIHALAPARPSEGLESHELFERLLQHEVRRARTLGGQLALLAIEHLGDAPLGRWFPGLRGLLRAMDVAGAYSERIVEILLPEASEAFARAVAEQARAELGAPLRCAVAGYPWAGSSADALLGVCLEALRACTAAIPIRRAEDRTDLLATAAAAPGERDEPVVLSARMRELYRLARHAARADIAVLIRGETGAGKELVARAIHGSSPRSERRLCSLNCGAIPEQLVQSALFGHERGAFTGAEQQRAGIFERAAGGTVFLDEIGELSASAQVALLRVLEQKVVTRVGGSEEIPVDVRVVAATHQDLEALCAAKAFRLDLLYRLNTMVLELPPLRERLDELEALAHHFLVRANRQNRRQLSGFSAEALQAMRRHAWPGNVRELRNVVERAVVIAQHEAIALDDLPGAMRRLGATSAPPATAAEQRHSVAVLDAALDFKARVQRFEADLIERAYRACDFNQSETSRRLQIPLRTLINKLHAYKIDKPG